MSLIKKENYLFRAVHFFFKHAFKNFSYLYLYALHFFDKDYTFKVNFYSPEELVEKVSMGKSIIRFGDGDIYTINYGGQPYQRYYPKLREGLLNIFLCYSENSPYIIGYNKLPLETKNADMRRVNLLHSWLPVKVFYDLRCKKEAKYFDASIFYYNHIIPKYFENYLSSQRLLLVTNKRNIEKFKNNKKIPFKEVFYLETPEVDTFSRYSEIIESIRNMVLSFNDSRKMVVIMACGPAGKVMAYDLSLEKIQVLDLGHGIEVAYSDKKIDHIANPFLVRG